MTKKKTYNMNEKFRSATIGSVVADYARENGFDGIFNKETGCACTLEQLSGCDCADFDMCQFGKILEPEDRLRGETNDGVFIGLE